jgi:hypothetical protein
MAYATIEQQLSALTVQGWGGVGGGETHQIAVPRPLTRPPARERLHAEATGKDIEELGNELEVA